MKKIQILLPLLFLSFIPKLHAEWSPEFERAKDKAKLITYRLPLAATVMSTGTVLISRSNTTTWPHKEGDFTDYLEIQSIRIDVDKADPSTCTIRLGVINYIDSSSSTVTWFYNKEFELNASSSNVTPDFIQYPAPISLKVLRGTGTIEGTTPDLLSNYTSNFTVFTSSVAITPSPGGAVSPGYGDLVAYIQKAAAAITFTFEIVYNSSR